MGGLPVGGSADIDNPNHVPSEDELSLYFRAALELAVRRARKGDPWDFVRLQWPWLVIPESGPGSEDRPYFETDLRLDKSQVDILRHVFAPDHTECFIKGCTKYGKGFTTALCVNIWFDVFPESKIILTGPDYNHVRTNLFAEVSSLRQKMVAPGGKPPENLLVGIGESRSSQVQSQALALKEIQSDRIVDKSNPKHFIVIANPKTGEGFSGQHSPHTLFVFDEASVVDDLYYENAKKQARFIIALSNPRVLSGFFRESFGSFEPDECKSIPTSFGVRRLVTADGGETVNVKNKRIEKPFAPPDGIEIDGVRYEPGQFIPDAAYEKVKPLIPAQVDYARYFDIMSDPDENNRNVFGRGRFPKEDAELQVVLASYVQRANVEYTRTADPATGETVGDTIEVHAFGLDVATSSEGDTTALAAGGEGGCRKIHTRPGAETPQTAGWVLDTVLREYGIDLKLGHIPVAIDYGGGYGSGVGDRLRELGVRVIRVIPNKRSSKPNLYANVRAEVWGELGKRLNPSGEWADKPPWALPPDQMMAEDMVAQEKIIKSDGICFQLIPKARPNASYNGKTVMDRLGGRSPDRGDAVCLLWHAVQADLSIEDYAGRSLVLGSVGDDAASSRQEMLDSLGKRRDGGAPAGVGESDELRRKWEWESEIRHICERMDSGESAANL